MKDKLYKMMSWPQIEAIVYGEEGNPQTILGRHSVSAYTLYQTFIPTAESVVLHIEGQKKTYNMEMADEAGFFAIAIVGKEPRDYTYEVVYKDGSIKMIHDPYIFEVSLDKDQRNSWNKGTSLDSYRFMGAHETVIDGISGVVFRVWAPNAIRVSVIGDFNDWDGHAHPMMYDEETGIYSLFIPELAAGNRYMYEVCVKGGGCSVKLDPYARSFDEGAEVGMITASDNYEWNDKDYLKNRKDFDISDAVINIFELDNSLWETGNEDITDANVDELCDYVADIGYTHVLLNVRTDRFYCINTTLYENYSLKKIIDRFHSKGIGVLLRINLCFFDQNDNGLKAFDGTYLYGHLDDRKRYNAMFGYNFNYGREQVKDFLMSNVIYWFDEFHIDGIHVDEISTVLFLNYGKNDNETAYNMYGGIENLEAIDFFKSMNVNVHKLYKGVITMTKETGMLPNVTTKVANNGLGFDLIWDNGFGDDYMDFLRKGDTDIHKLTDSMAYAYVENYILTISKEDVISANDFDYERVAEGAGYFDYVAYEDSMKMAVKRATLSFFCAHPGKKLIYIGQDEKNLSSRLNDLYRTLPAFHALDRYKEGFEWVRAIDNGTGVIAFMRKSEVFRECILVVCNFSLEDYKDYKLGMPYEGKYKAIFNSEEKCYGGNFKLPAKMIDTVDEEYDGKECTLTIPIPAMSVSYYSYSPYSEDEFLKIAARKAAKIKKELEKEAERRAKELEKEALRKAREYNSLTKSS